MARHFDSSRGDVFKLNRLLPNGDYGKYRHSRGPGVVVVALGRHFSCGTILSVPLIPDIEVIFLPFFGSINLRMLQLIARLQTYRTTTYSSELLADDSIEELQ